MEDRDAQLECAECGAGMGRTVARVQRPIVRPAGYSLRPGERGYWSFETAEGRVQRPSPAPFAKAEQLYRAPPIPTDE